MGKRSYVEILSVRTPAGVKKRRRRMTLREELEGQVFMIAQALVASGKHTNRYELARDALETAIAVKDEVEKYCITHIV
jgi:hypothetical protein